MEVLRKIGQEGLVEGERRWIRSEHWPITSPENFAQPNNSTERQHTRGYNTERRDQPFALLVAPST